MYISARRTLNAPYKGKIEKLHKINLMVKLTLIMKFQLVSLYLDWMFICTQRVLYACEANVHAFRHIETVVTVTKQKKT